MSGAGGKSAGFAARRRWDLCSRSHRRSLVRRMLWVVAAAAAASLVVMSASASAAGWNCSAAAVSGAPLGTPVTANAGQATCKAASGGANLPALPLPLQANVMSARTTLDGPANQPAQQTAGATAEGASQPLGPPHPPGPEARGPQGGGCEPVPRRPRALGSNPDINGPGAGIGERRHHA